MVGGQFGLDGVVRAEGGDPGDDGLLAEGGGFRGGVGRRREGVGEGAHEIGVGVGGEAVGEVGWVDAEDCHGRGRWC